MPDLRMMYQLSNDLQDAQQRQYQQLCKRNRQKWLEIVGAECTVRVRQPADFNQQEKMNLDEEISNCWIQGPSRIQSLMNQSAWNRFDSDDVEVIATKERERRLSKAAEEISKLNDDVETLQENDKKQRDCWDRCMIQGWSGDGSSVCHCCHYPLTR
jgi:hypothetical protein